MRPIFMAMLVVQAGLVLVTALTLLGIRHAPDRRCPIWSSLAIALVIGAGASFSIADRHGAEADSDLVECGAALLLGMAIVCMLLQLRHRFGRDGTA